MAFPHVRSAITLALCAALSLAVATPPASGSAAPALPEMTVYKSPTCGCCSEWVKHVRAAGFKVKVIDMDDVSSIKAESGVPGKLASCHTALVGGYVIEGHVPADLIKRLLQERAKIRGLSVPGMVAGSPGMEGGPPQHYDVVTFDAKGRSSVYARR